MCPEFIVTSGLDVDKYYKTTKVKIIKLDI